MSEISAIIKAATSLLDDYVIVKLEFEIPIALDYYENCKDCECTEVSFYLPKELYKTMSDSLVLTNMPYSYAQKIEDFFGTLGKIRHKHKFIYNSVHPIQLSKLLFQDNCEVYFISITNDFQFKDLDLLKQNL